MVLSPPPHPSSSGHITLARYHTLPASGRKPSGWHLVQAARMGTRGKVCGGVLSSFSFPSLLAQCAQAKLS